MKKKPPNINYAIGQYIRGKGNKRLLECLPTLEKLYLKHSVEENDFRCGEDTYGYKSIESIKDNMIYISDRWKAAFRIKWLIDGLKQGKI